MKKLLCLFLPLVLLLNLAACTTPPVIPVETTKAPDESSSVSDVGGADNPTSLNTIEDRSSLLEGKTDEEKAVFLWNGMFDENSVINDTVQSGTIVSHFLINGTSSTYPLAVEMDSTLMSIEESNELETLETFHYEEASTKLTLGDLLDQTTRNKRGYVDGKIIEYSSGSDETYALYATHTPLEWKHYQELSASDNDDATPVVKKENCVVKSFEEEGQNYTVSFSHFTVDGLASINEAFGEMLDLLDQEPTDVTLHATFRRDLLPTEMTIVYVFDEDDAEKAPAFSVTYEFSNYNKTQAFSIDLSSYTDVKDLLSVRYLMEKQDILAEADEADFEYVSTHEIIRNGVSLGGSSLLYDITQRDDPLTGYSFSMEEYASGDTYEYSEQTIYVNTETSEYADTMTDAQAKNLIRGFIDVLDTSLARVSTAEKTPPVNTLHYKVFFSKIEDALINDLIKGINGATANHITAIEAYALYSDEPYQDFGKLNYSVKISLTVGSTSYVVQYSATVRNVVMS